MTLQPLVQPALRNEPPGWMRGEGGRAWPLINPPPCLHGGARYTHTPGYTPRPLLWCPLPPCTASPPLDVGVGLAVCLTPTIAHYTTHFGLPAKGGGGGQGARKKRAGASLLTLTVLPPSLTAHHNTYISKQTTLGLITVYGFTDDEIVILEKVNWSHDELSQLHLGDYLG